MTNNEITSFVFLEDNNPEGDIALVFGTVNAWAGSVTRAAELYSRGLVPKLLVSGGPNEKWGITEGDWMKAKLIERGVPEGAILNENKSTNTLENAVFSRDLIDKEIGLQNIKTIIAVVKNYHARRALMTLRKHFPDHIKFKSAPYYSEYYGFTRDNWQDSSSGRDKVYEELEKIERYLAKGDIKEL